MIGLIDFDNTCVFSAYNEYCTEDTGAARVLRKLRKAGHELVLWTCRNSSKDNPHNYYYGTKRLREEDSLGEAVRWFKEHHIKLHSINNVPETFGEVGESRKPIAGFVIDDLNVGTPIIRKEVDCINYETGKVTRRCIHCVDWIKIEEMLKNSGIL